MPRAFRGLASWLCPFRNVSRVYPRSHARPCYHFQMGRMPREFTSQKAIRNHAELTGYMYLWEGTHAFATRRRLLSPDQYEIVDVRTDRGMTRAMLFPKAILKAEWDAAAPLRDALTIRRERWRPLRSEKGKNGQRPNERSPSKVAFGHVGRRGRLEQPGTALPFSLWRRESALLPLTVRAPD